MIDLFNFGTSPLTATIVVDSPELPAGGADPECRAGESRAWCEGGDVLASCRRDTDRNYTSYDEESCSSRYGEGILGCLAEGNEADCACEPNSYWCHPAWSQPDNLGIQRCDSGGSPSGWSSCLYGKDVPAHVAQCKATCGITPEN